MRHDLSKAINQGTGLEMTESALAAIEVIFRKTKVYRSLDMGFLQGGEPHR